MTYWDSSMKISVQICPNGTFCDHHRNTIFGKKKGLVNLATLSLPNDKILHVTNLEYNKINVAQMLMSVFDRIENIVGKRRNCWLPAFSPFSTMF